LDGIDYVSVDTMPQPVFPLAAGRDDDGWPTGNGGGENASFVQENGSINDLPGNARNREVAQQADNDYYLAGVYTSVIPANEVTYGSYTPIGIVPATRKPRSALSRALTMICATLQPPSTLKPTNQVAISFDAFNLDDSVENPHYGIEIYFNGVQVQPEKIIRTNDLGVEFTTPPFTLASVNAQFGLGPDNIVSLRGVNYSAEGGGNWMGIDYVQLQTPGDTEPLKFLPPTVSHDMITLTWTGNRRPRMGTRSYRPMERGQWQSHFPIHRGH